jgi:hypothetical protein
MEYTTVQAAEEAYDIVPLNCCPYGAFSSWLQALDDEDEED